MTRPNCSRTLAYSAAISVAPRATPTASADSSSRARSRRAGRAPASTVAAAPDSVTRAERRLGSRLGGTLTSAPPAARSMTTTSSPAGASSTSATAPPSATSTVPLTLPSLRSSVLWSATAAVREPSARPGRNVFFAASLSQPLSTAVAIAVGTNGPGVIARPSSSTATTRSSSPPPEPPYSSGTCSPGSPSPARSDHSAGRSSVGASSSAREAAPASRRVSSWETESARARCSSVMAIDMGEQSHGPVRAAHCPGPSYILRSMQLSMGIGYAGDHKKAAARVRDLEHAGLDVAWVAEAYTFDAVSYMGYLAAVTERVQIAAGILPIYTRTPSLIAMTAAGVDNLSDGRCILGLGASGPQVIEGFHGVRYDKPIGRTREIIEICRTVWKREEKLTHDGPVYRLPLPEDEGTGLGKPLKLINHPVRPSIPIFVAALGEKNLEMTAEIADGWLPIFFVPEKAKE